jgi:glycosyltransferase involved in cell wall biosynthesis
MTSQPSRPEVSVVIPFHNEVENLDALVAEVQAALGGRIDYELVSVDDGSDDGTGERLTSLAAHFPHLRVLHHARRSGQSAALVTGVRAARAPWIVTLDGDGQNDPADILRLLDRIRDPGMDPRLRLVIGERGSRQDSFVKRVSSRIANLVRSRLLHDSTPDTGCGLKLFDRDGFLVLPQFNHMHRFLPALFQRNGALVASVTVNHRPRLHGSSHYGVWDRLWVGMVDLLGVRWLQRRAMRVTTNDRSDDQRVFL